MTCSVYCVYKVTGAPPWSQAWGWGSQVSAWWPGLSPRGSARKSDMGPPSSRFTTRRRVQKGSVPCDLGGGRGPRQPTPRTVTLAMGTWNVTSLGEKEPELVREVERYRLEIVGLTSTHSLGTAWALEPNSLREAGLSSTLELPAVRGGELVWACL